MRKEVFAGVERAAQSRDRATRVTILGGHDRDLEHVRSVPPAGVKGCCARDTARSIEVMLRQVACVRNEPDEMPPAQCQTHLRPVRSASGRLVMVPWG